MLRRYQHLITLLNKDRQSLGCLPAGDVDYEPALEAVRLLGIQTEILSPEEMTAPALLAPVWLDNEHELYLAGFQARIASKTGREAALDFTPTYFAALAQQAAQAFISQGKLKEGEIFYYLVAAARRTNGAPHAAGKMRLRAEDAAPALAIREMDTAAAPAIRAEHRGPEDGPGQMPIHIHGRLIAEATSLSNAAGAFETGGLLIGYLNRDKTTRALSAEITAQIPAEHTESKLASLRFTPATWAAARAAIAARGTGESFMGWWHCHNYLHDTCKDCAQEKRKACGANALFFSDKDLLLHRTCFPSAYNSALLISNSPCSGLSYAMYGWVNGLIKERGFHVCDEVPAKAQSDSDNS